MMKNNIGGVSVLLEKTSFSPHMFSMYQNLLLIGQAGKKQPVNSFVGQNALWVGKLRDTCTSFFHGPTERSADVDDLVRASSITVL